MADKKALLEQSITATKGLRSSVSKIFEGLIQQSAEEKPVEKTEGPKTSELVENLKKNLVNTQKSLGTLEKTAALLGQVIKPDTSTSLGNPGLLSLDPTEDKTPLYGQLLDSYSWHEKLNVQSKQALTSLKRHHPYSIKRIDDLPVRKPSPLMPVKNIIEALKGKHPNLQICGLRVCGSTNALEVWVPRTFKAIVVLKYAVSIDQVIIRGVHESCLLEKKEDINTQSKHAVFKKLTDYANSAVLHYYSSTEPYQQILCVVRWLDSYHGLFARKCTKCEMHLKEESEKTPLPPCWRAFDTLLPYHFSCRP